MPHNKVILFERLSDELETLSANLEDPGWTRPQAIASFLRPIERTAWSINSLGWRLLKVSSRLHDGCPAGYEEFWEDGRRVGRREVAQVLIKPGSTTDVLEPLVMGLRMPPEDIVGHIDREATR